MIGKLKGVLVEVESNKGLIETASGVFYTVFLTPSLIKRQKIGDGIEIHTYLQVREDNWTLYGFEDKKQYNLFVMLLTVSGIGPKSAFIIISYRNVDEIFSAVSDNNVECFSDIQGIGKKSAQKILLELSQKIGKTFDIGSLAISSEDATVIDALVSLGFVRYEARRAVSHIDTKLSIEGKIQKAIKIMTQKA